MQATIRALDRLLSRRNHVQVFTSDPECIFRLALKQTTHFLSLPDGDFPVGTPAAMIHLWNECMPPLPASGADLVYARRLYHLQLHSFSLVARHIQIAAEYQPAQLLGGITVLAPVDMPDGGTAMLKHFGFSVVPYHSPLGGFGEFWENLLTWGLMWTYNPPSLRSRSLWGLQRSEFWMSRARFLKKFGLATPSP